MAKPKIREQISDTENAIKYFPKHEKILKVHKKILEIILPLDEVEKRGAYLIFTKEELEKFLNKSKKPISHYLKASDFDLIRISDVVKKIIQVLIGAEVDDDKLRLFAKKLENGEGFTADAISAILSEDYKWVENQSEKFGVEPSLLLLIFDSPLKPFFEQVSRDLEEMIKDTWLDPYCPVCGRQSNVARKRKLNRYMICSYCGLEYLVDMFKCINCGNVDPTLMGFIKINEHKNYELNYCGACKHYIKILDEDVSMNKIPRGLEEILTRELDTFAKTSNLHLRRA